MKALVFSMLVIASLVACTNESDPINEVDNGKPVEIKLNAGIITTKAPIDSENDLPKAPVTGVQIVQAPDGIAAVWTGVSTVASTANIAVDGKMAFTVGKELYYNADDNKKTFLIGYYPMPTDIIDGAASWTITGKEDIIATGVVSGDKTTNKQTPLAFKFDHLLTQLQIEIRGNVAAQTAFGKITGIKITGAKTSASLTPDNTSLTWKGTDTSLNVWSGAEGSESEVFDVTLSETSQKIGYVMLAPAAKYTVEVTSENITTSKEITIANTAVAGSAHKIALTFSGSEVSASATLTGWVTSADGGTGTID